MYYILDDLGYIEEVSTHYIERDSKTCTEYTGAIPTGYETLDDWVLNANIRAYKLNASGNLVYDANRDAALQAEYNASLLPNEFILYENGSGSTGTITLNDSTVNYKRIDIFFMDDWGIRSYISTEGLGTGSVNGAAINLTVNRYISSSLALTFFSKLVRTSGNTIVPDSNYTGQYDSTYSGATNIIKIFKVVGYK
jgi:hypothetical protein